MGIYRGQVGLYLDFEGPDDQFAIQHVGHHWYPPPDFGSLASPLLPHFSSSQDEVLATAPLWLLAAVCLAWPVTSLLVRRRRRGRGFEVEAKDGGAVSRLGGAGR